VEAVTVYVWRRRRLVEGETTRKNLRSVAMDIDLDRKGYRGVRLGSGAAEERLR
jgi:hypothetical protein